MDTNITDQTIFNTDLLELEVDNAPSLILDLSVSSIIFVRYIHKAQQLSFAQQSPVNLELAFALVSKVFFFEDGTPINQENLESFGVDVGIIIGNLFREALMPLTDVEFLDIPSEDLADLSSNFKNSRYWRVGRQEVKIKPILSLDLTTLSLAIAQGEFKVLLLYFLQKHYVVNNKPVEKWEDIDYPTMCIVWAQLQQLVLMCPKYKKSFGLPGNSRMT